MVLRMREVPHSPRLQARMRHARLSPFAFREGVSADPFHQSRGNGMRQGVRPFRDGRELRRKGRPSPVGLAARGASPRRLPDARPRPIRSGREPSLHHLRQGQEGDTRTLHLHWIDGIRRMQAMAEPHRLGRGLRLPQEVRLQSHRHRRVRTHDVQLPYPPHTKGGPDATRTTPSPTVLR